MLRKYLKVDMCYTKNLQVLQFIRFISIIKCISINLIVIIKFSQNKNRNTKLPRNYSSYRNGNSTTFFLYICNAKKIFLRLVLSYLKKNNSQCQFCVYKCNLSKSQIDRLVVAHANTKRRRGTNKHGHSSAFSKVKH